MFRARLNGSGCRSVGRAGGIVHLNSTVTTGRPDAVVVGSGPNGLAAAVTLARAGLQVQVLEAKAHSGGGTRTVPLANDQSAAADQIITASETEQVVEHDLCSAVHPLVAGSPFFTEFDLQTRGVTFVVPPVAYAHVWDGHRAALAYPDIDRTAERLGRDGPAWRALFHPLVEHAQQVLDLIFDHRVTSPRLARVLPETAMMLSQGTPLWKLSWRTEEAPALLTGVAGHAGSRIPGLVSAGTLLMLSVLAHRNGWPIPVGGSRRISAALEQDLVSHGGVIRTGYPISSARQLPPARAYLFDTDPTSMAEICDLGSRAIHRRAGVGVAKVDFELTGPVPWLDPELGQASTVHLGGHRGVLTRREDAVRAGSLGHGLILASDPAAFDISRIRAGKRPFWTYAHVAYGSTEDVGAAVQQEIEAAAPGFSDLVARRRTIPAAAMSEHNANYRGGDIALGLRTWPDAMFGTNRRLKPYTTAREDVFLCSAAAPPGPGVHGMCGYRAARTVLAKRFGIHRRPDLTP